MGANGRTPPTAHWAGPLRVFILCLNPQKGALPGFEPTNESRAGWQRGEASTASCRVGKEEKIDPIDHTTFFNKHVKARAGATSYPNCPANGSTPYPLTRLFLGEWIIELGLATFNRSPGLLLLVGPRLVYLVACLASLSPVQPVS